MLLTAFLITIFLAVCLLPAVEIRWEAAGRLIVDGRRPRVMGIVNVTPDSFSESPGDVDLAATTVRGKALAAAGADLLDVGGESSRPGAQPVTPAEEIRRVVPVVEALAGSTGLPISVDTAKADVARHAIRAGASIVNDITALAGDPDLVGVVREVGAGVVLMHMQGTPQTMQHDPRYGDVVTEVYDFLARRAEWAECQGIPRSRIALDPGIGFGKTIAHNLQLLRNLGRFATLGCAVLVGTSRKGFLGQLTGRPVNERATASVVSSLVAIVHGARVVRVHDVEPMVDAIQVWGELHGWGEPVA